MLMFYYQPYDRKYTLTFEANYNKKLEYLENSEINKDLNVSE